jgi:uncharacterized membrane protein
MTHPGVETMKALPRPPAYGGPFVMDAQLHPHRSLSNLGFLVLMGVLGVAMAIAGTLYALTGAWPVLGFFGLDILLVYLAFRLSYKAGRAREQVRVGRDAIWVTRHHATGHRQDFTMQTAFSSVELLRPEAHDCQLRLRSHAGLLVLGAFLPPPERAEFGTALRSAIDRALAAR